MRRLVGIAVVLVIAVLAFVIDLVRDAGGFRTLKPHGLERCVKVPGPTGAEDLVFDADSGLVLISSQDFRELEHAGGLWAFDPAKGGAPVPVANDFPGALHPHGLGLWRGADGQRRLFVVHHPTRLDSRVEIFALEPGPSLRHLKTVDDPLMVSLNDVAPVGPEQFYVSMDAATKADTAGRLAETFLRLPLSKVLYFDEGRGSVVASRFTYANGVAVSADGRTVFVTESTGRHLVAFARDEKTGALEELARTRFPAALDNLAFDEDGRLWLAAHPNMLAFLSHAKDPRERSPSQLFRARFVAPERRFEVDELGVDDGSGLSGSSIALPLSPSRFLMGSVFEAHLLDCPR
ncbi:MAG: SMP-30/gluconolactonase/LRE family protein [Myxococcota bacterium]